VRWDEDSQLESVSVDDLKPARASERVAAMPIGAKQEAFQRLANQRLDQARKYVRLLGNLANNRGRCEYSSGQEEDDR
jgi:hypothetical protein